MKDRAGVVAQRFSSGTHKLSGAGGRAPLVFTIARTIVGFKWVVLGPGHVLGLFSCVGLTLGLCFGTIYSVLAVALLKKQGRWCNLFSLEAKPQSLQARVYLPRFWQEYFGGGRSIYL